MGFELFDRCFHFLLSQHDVINLAFRLSPIKINEIIKRLKSRKSENPWWMSSTVVCFTEHGHHESCERVYTDKWLTVFTGLSCLWDQSDLAGHICSLARFVVIRQRKRFLHHCVQCSASKISCGLRSQWGFLEKGNNFGWVGFTHIFMLAILLLLMFMTPLIFIQTLASIILIDTRSSDWVFKEYLILTLNSSVAYFRSIFKLTLQQDPFNLFTDVVSHVKNFCEIRFEVLLLALQFRLQEVTIVLKILQGWESHSDRQV